jgi:uncharacterized protein
MFEGTQRGLLQFLFGATALIMTGAAMGAPESAAPASTYFRRNLLLMAFGAVDFTLLLWPGDILFDYGLAGLLLFPLRRLRPRSLILAGAGLLVLISATPLPAYFGDVALRSRSEAASSLPESARTAEDRRAIQQWREAQAPVDLHRVELERTARLGGYGANFDYSLRRSVRVRGSPAYLIYLLESLGTMMIGMALFKTGVLQGKSSRRFYLAMLAGGYGAGWAVNAAEIWYRLATNFAPTPLYYVTYELGRLPTILGHVALIHLILSTKQGGRLLSIFAAPGRMALSCYVARLWSAAGCFSPALASGCTPHSARPSWPQSPWGSVSSN